MKTRTWIMLLVLCVMLVLAACGGSDQDSGVALEAVSDDSAAAEQNEAADAALDLAALDGALVYAEGETLYYWPLGRAGAEPEPVASGVDLATVQISPDNTYLLYATAIQENISRRLTTVYVVDLATRESTELSTLLTPNWGVMSWSPDGEWVILYVASRGVYAHRVDGSAAWEIEQPRPATPYWLASGGVLLADVNFRDNTQVFEGVKRLDLATGAVEILDVDLDAFNADPAMIYDIAAELGETLVEPIPGSAALQVQFPDEMNDGMNPACARWQITRGSFLVPVEEQELVYNAPDVYGLSEVRDMPDGSIVFIQWEVDECRIVNRPVGTLMRLVPGEAPGHLLDGVFGGYKIGREWEYFFGPQARVALSPDGRTAAWLGGTSDDGTSSLNLTDLDGGAQVTLRDARGPAGYDESFINGQMYSAVYWLPS